MIKHNDNIFQKVTWQDVRDDVKKINPDLANDIDEICPDNNYELLKVRYNFGDLIVKSGVLQIPDNNSLAGFTPIDKINELKDFSYSAIPLSLLLNKSSEVFLSEDSRIIPLNMLNPGSFFGTFETLDFIFGIAYTPVWNVSAGARSLFMLAKLSEAPGFKRLQSVFKVSPNTLVKNIAHHWYLFKQIANHQNFRQSWSSEILIFSRKWFECSKDKIWNQFNNRLFKQGWQQAGYAINQIKLDIFWQIFIKAISDRHLKPAPYLSDTIKHLLAITTGSVPGFIPTDNSQLAAPSNGLKEAILDVYLLKNYLPTILQPSLLNSSGSVYYSLSHPTLLAGSPSGKNAPTIMSELKQTKFLLDTLQLYLQQDEKNLIKDIRFDYFHVETEKDNYIGLSKVIPMQDKRFSTETSNYGGRNFCTTSTFWRGCIKIIRV